MLLFLIIIAQKTLIPYNIDMEGNSIQPITKYDTPKKDKGVDEVFRKKTVIFDLEKKDTLKDLFGLDTKENK